MSEIHPSLLKRKIIHVDMDAFYAAVEAKDDPALKGRPIIVGGSPESRAVVCTASYEARKFGVRSAMACSKAKRLCPQGIFVRPRFDRYVEVSAAIREIFGRYSPLIEPLSLDEAFLDVTQNVLGLFATEIAKRIRREIHSELGLTASAGVAPNKMLAKIASDLRKPNGLSVILPNEVPDFVAPLALTKIHGIGPVTSKRLEGFGLRICSDVTARSKQEVTALLGTSFGDWLYERAQGLDDREVEVSRERKSYSQETTFAQDLKQGDLMKEALASLANDLAAILHEDGRKGRTLTLKARYPDFQTVTRSWTLDQPTSAAPEILNGAISLLTKTAAMAKGVRLLGIGVTKLSDATPTPIELEGASPARSLFGD